MSSHGTTSSLPEKGEIGPDRIAHLGGIVLRRRAGILRLRFGWLALAWAVVSFGIASNPGYAFAIFMAGFLVYLLCWAWWDWRTRDILTAMPEAVIIERRSLRASTRTLLSMVTIKSIDVVDAPTSSALRLTLMDGTAHTVILGKHQDHCAIADWLNSRLAGRDLIEPSDLIEAIPEELRDLRRVSARLREV